MTDIIFDKTGTLTTGNLRLSSVSVNHESAWPPDLQHAATEESTVLVSRLNALIRLSNVDLSLPEHDEGFNRPHCLLWLAGCLQSISDHPIAESVVRYCRQELRVGDLGTIEEMPQLVQPTEFRNIPGEGCIGQVDISPLLNLFGMPANEFEGRNRIRQIAIGNYRLCTRFLETWNCDSDQLNRLKSANINHQGQCYSGETYVYIVFERYYLGHLGFRDFPKQEARSVIAELKVSSQSDLNRTFNRCQSASEILYILVIPSLLLSSPNGRRSGCAQEIVRAPHILLDNKSELRNLIYIVKWHQMRRQKWCRSFCLSLFHSSRYLFHLTTSMDLSPNVS